MYIYIHTYIHIYEFTSAYIYVYVWKDAFNWTKDVPENYLRELGQIWTLQQTEYIDGVAALYTTKGTRFDGVFTKLSATWSQ